jgi:flagellar basal-body rod protein FlgG
MPIGIYAAASGMAAQQVKLDAIANDLANTGTAGYKGVRVGFADLVYAERGGVPIGSGATAVDAGRSMRQGTMTESGDPLSMAIDGRGYFQVRQADGTTALTRDGSFRLDARGELVTATGARMVPPVRLPAGTAREDVAIGPDGAITVKGAAAGKLALVEVPAPEGLRALGDNLFAVTAASGAAKPAAAAGQIRQGMLEGSNVDVAASMVELIAAQRSFELASRAIRTQDQLMEIANGIRA